MKKRIKDWWEDLVAWLKSYRNKPTITITAAEIVSGDDTVFKMQGRMHANIVVTGQVVINNPDLFDAPDQSTNVECSVTTKEFFDQLGKWYSGHPRAPYLVKFYCQVETFSYEIYKEERAFFGSPAYTSEIYDWWHSGEDMYNILRDIERQLFILKSNN